MQKSFTLLFLFLQTLVFSQEKKILKTYTTDQLNKDFDLMVDALKEAHPGLYWYNSIPEFDRITKHGWDYIHPKSISLSVNARLTSHFLMR